tara:strand:+ start:6 stop:1598 length:1593 start_codon:yes stop_codon:yes gene_type:complete
MSVTTTGYKVGKQPIAQSFYVDEPRGIYCTKFDLFFKTADENAPVQIQIRPMINGFPSSTRIIPGSIKSLPGSTFTGGASISADASVATTFEFDEPIFLKGLIDYALVVITDSKDYEIFIAEINEFVVGSTEKRVNKQPTLGSLFYSQNGATFTPAQNQDLTFKLYKAKFKHNTATVSLHNASLPKDLLRKDPIVTIKNSQVVKVFHPNHGMQVGQPVVLSGVDSGGVGGILASTLNKRYNVTAIDHGGYQFTADSSADSDAIGGGSLVQSTKNILYDTIYPSFATIVNEHQILNARVKTITGKSYAGTETAFQKDTSFRSIQLNENNTDTILRMVAHDSAETSELGAGVKSLDMQIEMKGADSNSAPMIDLQRSSVGLISNIIDRQYDSSTSSPGFFNAPLVFRDETDPRSGTSAAKHLTRKITLGEESVGLKVLLTANRPNATDFQVFFRTCAEGEVLEDKNFILAEQENTIASNDNLLDKSAYTYLIGGQGGDLLAFTQFQLKIVFRSVNQALVPRISDLRVIALSA